MRYAAPGAAQCCMPVPSASAQRFELRYQRPSVMALRRRYNSEDNFLKNTNASWSQNAVRCKSGFPCLRRASQISGIRLRMPALKRPKSTRGKGPSRAARPGAYRPDQLITQGVDDESVPANRASCTHRVPERTSETTAFFLNCALVNLAFTYRDEGNARLPKSDSTVLP
jgi:hypothetical protein